jgi:hypothetical protein
LKYKLGDTILGAKKLNLTVKKFAMNRERYSHLKDIINYITHTS